MIDVYGPATAPRIEHDASGRVLDFPTLTIDAGQFLRIDVAERTVRYNALASDSRYDDLDFDESEWFYIHPGTQRIRFEATSPTAPAQAVITWRDAWL